MLRRWIVFVLLLGLAWGVMTTTHELGHILAGWLGGATLQQADLAPWRLPYSTFEPDPYPLVTLWGGPLLGVVFPVVIALLLRRETGWFIAWFCTLANGSYLAIGWLLGEQHLDSAKLLERGAHPATMALFCLCTIPAGYVGFRQQCIRLLRSPSRWSPDSSILLNRDADPDRGTES